MAHERLLMMERELMLPSTQHFVVVETLPYGNVWKKHFYVSGKRYVTVVISCGLSFTKYNIFARYFCQRKNIGTNQHKGDDKHLLNLENRSYLHYSSSLGLNISTYYLNKQTS